jgi:hypothetical protein
VAREKRIVVEADDRDNRAEVAGAFEHSGDRFDWDRDGDAVYCYLTMVDDSKALESEIVGYLREFDLDACVSVPLPVEFWDERASRYFRPGAEHFKPVHDVTWAVTV